MSGKKIEEVQEAELIFIFFFPEQTTVISIYCEFTRIHLENNSWYTEVLNIINRDWETGPVCMRTETIEVMCVNEKKSIY